MDLTIRNTTVVDVNDRPFLRGGHITFKTAGVTLDSVQVTPDTNGKKIVAAGRIIGKQSNGKYKVATTGTKATATFGTGNASFRVTAKAEGTDGNTITVELIDPGAANATLSVDTAGRDITVRLATNSVSAITSTAAEVVAAINAEPQASSLVLADLPSTSDGSAVVSTLAETALSGGAPAGSGLSGFMVLLDEADVTEGDGTFGAFDHAEVIESRLPDAYLGVVPAELKALVPHIIFA